MRVARAEAAIATGSPQSAWALFDAQLNYYRPVDFRSLMLGGLKGLQTLASTRGLEQTFNGLADDTKRAQFLADVAAQLKIVDGANAAPFLDEVVDCDPGQLFTPRR